MAQQSRDTLDTYFTAGKKPTELQMADVVDSVVNIADDLPLSIANGGTGAATAEDARTNLALVPGSNIQEYSPSLADISDIGGNAFANIVPYKNGADSFDYFSIGSGLLLADRVLNTYEAIPITVGDEATALTTGTAKATFRMPFAMTLTGVRASVTTAPTGSVLTVDINESGTTILSTKLTIDATQKTSTTAATEAVISDPDLADDAEITIDIDTVGSSVAGAGLKILLIGVRA